MLTEYGLNYIINLKTPEAWLQFAKYNPPIYIRRCLLILGYDINRKNHWKNFVFRIKNNLTRNESIANNSEFREFLIQVAYFKTLYIKNRSAIIIQRAYCLWKKRINSAIIIQRAVKKWLYQPGGPLMKHAQDRFYQNANKLANSR
ncbi:24558_t:CDS:1 [Gigaspora margarita]|uniref:24558_t:CDS:1 n=1 Tax=Gigaspora margarita TaxID=4874 RepID=A0ABN7UU50_GIGMA|nr:24558_t:CDS:1 [Gigaspora margarita]